MNINRCLTLMMLTMQSAIVHASGTVQCAAQIEVRQEVSGVPKGWQAFEPSTKHPLMSIVFSEGEPIHRVILLPTGEEGGAIATWTFTPSTEGYWVSCGYNSTSILISRKLPEGTASCRVEYDKDFNPPLPKKVECD